jgi:phospholipid/cholesterol/gamma-HCH transport system substrate-binding protein
MAIVAMIILAVLIFLLTGQTKLFSHNAILYIYLGDAAALAGGAPVRLNGINIGKVDTLDLSGERDPSRLVKVQMSVEAARLKDIPVDSLASISAENVLGTKYINIKSGQSAQTIKDGGEVKALDTREFQELVESAFPVLQSIQSILVRVNAIVSQVELGKGSVGKLLVDEELYNRLVATVSEFQKITATMSSGKGTVGKLLYDESMYNDARTALQHLDLVIQDIQQGQGTAGKFLKDPALYDETRATIAEARRVIDDINAGKGTAGKLLKDEALYNQLQTTVGKINNTIDRLNSGQGTAGQLLTNPQLYDSLNGLSNELNSLVKDIRSNPKKFLRIKLALF